MCDIAILVHVIRYASEYVADSFIHLHATYPLTLNSKKISKYDLVSVIDQLQVIFGKFNSLGDITL
jgi:enoyl-[acyl-carrier-protein] reductase (NADH)